MKTLIGYMSATALAVLLTGCGTSTANTSGPPETAAAQTTVTASTRTQPVSDETESAVIALGNQGAGAHVIAATQHDGLAVYGLDGERKATSPDIAASYVAISYGYRVNNQPTTLLATIGAHDNRLHVFTLHDGKPKPTQAQSAALDLSVEGMCLFRNRIDSHLYALILGGGGQIDQKIIYTNAEGNLGVREVRRIHFPSELKQCVADGMGHVYVSEQGTGIWRFNGDPESALDVTLVDAPKLGHITGETGGLAVYDGGDGSHWLLASQPSAGLVNVYDRDRDDAFIGSFAIAKSADGATIKEPGKLAVTSMLLGTAFPHGMLLVGADDDTDFRLVSMADVASALELAPGTPQDPRHAIKPPAPIVTALVETPAVKNAGDAADDPAVWANPRDPGKSLVVGTDKAAGMYVYDMHGKVLQFRADGHMNNTDLRSHFNLDGPDVVLVTASDRTHDSVAIYRLDTTAGKLVDVADGKQHTHMGDPYGLCMYRNPDNGNTYVFVNNKDGLMRQWQLLAADGRVHIDKVRQFRFNSQVEGCAADDVTGSLFVDEEDVALWALSALPDAGDKMTAIDRVADNPALKSDLEGLGVYDLGNGKGYIVISVQGNNTYAVYRLEGKHEYLGSFAVVANPALGIDGISQTDGLDLTSHNLGPGFEHGAMIAQDGRNVLPQQHQNYKYVSWDAIAKALDLDVRNNQQ